MAKIKFKEEKEAIDALKKKYKLREDNFRVNDEGHVYCLNLSGKRRITKIEGLDALSKLQELYLGGNKITKIEGLDLDNAQAVVKYCKEAIKKV